MTDVANSYTHISFPVSWHSVLMMESRRHTTIIMSHTHTNQFLVLLKAKFKNKKNIIVFCRSGNRSGMAVSILKQNGVADVFNGGGLGDLQILLN